MTWRCVECFALVSINWPMPSVTPPVCSAGHEPREMEPAGEIGGPKEQAVDW